MEDKKQSKDYRYDYFRIKNTCWCGKKSKKVFLIFNKYPTGECSRECFLATLTILKRIKDLYENPKENL